MWMVALLKWIVRFLSGEPYFHAVHESDTESNSSGEGLDSDEPGHSARGIQPDHGDGEHEQAAQYLYSYRVAQRNRRHVNWARAELWLNK